MPRAPKAGTSETETGVQTDSREAMMATRKAHTADEARRFTDIPNIGPAMAKDFGVLGLSDPADLAGRDPYALYDELCERTGVRHDPCVIDVFISAVRFMEGAPPLPWWHYTAERKARAGASGQL